MSSGMLITAARRRALVVVLCAAVVPSAALGYSVRQDKLYTASAQLLFRDASFDEKLFGSSVLRPSDSPERQAATNLLLVSNRRVAELTAKKRGHGLTGRQIAGKLDVTLEGQADVISVSITDSDPVRAAQLANTYATEFIRFRQQADRDKIAETRALVDRQLKGLSSRGRSTADEDELRRQADQLRVLASLQTGDAELVQAAEPPTSASSPRTLRNILTGGLLGLLIGLGLAFVLERVDRRLRDPDEIEAAFGRPILGTVPESRALERKGSALTGVSAWTESQSFSMIRANLRYFNIARATRSILVTSAAPGDGKTTITWNLAAAAVAAGDTVLVIEADLRHPSVLGEPARSAPGLGALLAGQAALEDVLTTLPVNVVRGHGEPPRRMDVIPAGSVPPNPIDLLESEQMKQLIRSSEDRYDLVIIDTPPVAIVSDAIPLVKVVSGIIVVTRLGRSTRTSMQQLRRQLENLEAPTLGLVVNGVSTPVYGYGYGYGSYRPEVSGANGTPSTLPDEPDPGAVGVGSAP